MCILKLAIVISLISLGIVKSYANQTTENVDASFSAIKNEVSSVVRAISRIEQKKHGNTNHIQFSVDIPANNVATLGLILDTSISDELAQKGFLVTAVQEHSVGAMLGISVGEIIIRVNSERVTELTAEDRLTELLALQEGDILNLAIYNDKASSATSLRTAALVIEAVKTPRMQVIVGQP